MPSIKKKYCAPGFSVTPVKFQIPALDSVREPEVAGRRGTQAGRGAGVGLGQNIETAPGVGRTVDAVDKVAADIAPGAARGGGDGLSVADAVEESASGSLRVDCAGATASHFTNLVTTAVAVTACRHKTWAESEPSTAVFRLMQTAQRSGPRRLTGMGREGSWADRTRYFRAYERRL